MGVARRSGLARGWIRRARAGAKACPEITGHVSADGVSVIVRGHRGFPVPARLAARPARPPDRPSRRIPAAPLPHIESNPMRSTRNFSLPSARPLLASALLLVLAGISACGDDPFRLDWVENPREVTLFSLDRDERNRPSAFEMRQGQRVILESVGAAGIWDFALDTRDGELVFLPPRSVGVQSRAGLAEFPNTRFDELREAPSDTAAYTTRTPVPVRMGSVYAVRTRQQPGSFGESCIFYGKVQPLEIDVAAGTLLFRFDTSPDCNNPRLVPPGS